MTNYVLGFLFDPRFRQVVLIDKLRPSWQRGLLNGAGGKVEPGETHRDAMKREFKEECGIDINRQDLVCYAILRGHDYRMNLYAVTGNIDLVKQVTDERPMFFYVDFLPTRTVPCTRWMIMMAHEALTNPARDNCIYSIEDGV